MMDPHEPDEAIREAVSLPSPADKPPSGANWIHEITRVGYRLMARRDPERTALISLRGSDCDGSCGSPALIVARNVSLIAASIHTCA
jgi:hypothetical protein